MKIEFAEFKNLGPFEDWTLDLRGKTGLLAVCAPNGTGKSFSLESALFGAVSRQMPTQGSLANRARSRDSRLRVGLVNGAPWTITHMVDAISRKGESTVLAEDGTPAYKGTNVKSFAAFAEKHFPPPEVLSATQFSVQPNGKKSARNFLALDSSERISVILQTIGVERIERMAEGARKRAKEARAELETLVQRIEDARDGAPAAFEVAMELHDARATLEEQERVLEGLRAELVQLEAEERERAELERDAKQKASDRLVLAARVSELLGKADALCRKVDEASAIVGRADEIRSAAARATELRELIAAERRNIEQARKDADALAVRRAELERAEAEAGAKLFDLAERIENNRKIQARAVEIRQAFERVDAIRTRGLEIEKELALLDQRSNQLDAHDGRARAQSTEASSRVEAAQKRLLAEDEDRRLAATALSRAATLALAEATVTRLETEAEELRSKRLASIDDRVGSLRLALSEVLVETELRSAHDVAEKAINADDAAELASRTAPARIAELTSRLATARSEVTAAKAALATAQQAEQRLPMYDEAHTELARAEFARAEAERALVATQAEQASLKADRDGLANEERALEGESRELAPTAALFPKLQTCEQILPERQREQAAAREALAQAEAALAALPEPPKPSPEALQAWAVELGRLAPVAAQETALAQAEGTLAALLPELGRARRELGEAERALAEAPEPPTVPPPVDVEGGRAWVRKGEEGREASKVAVALLEQKLETAEATAERVAALEAERARLDGELSDWTRLALDLGRDGIQAAEVDSVGVELTECANELLHSCHGPRFTVSIETQRAKADGDLTDECRVNVVDTVAGREGDAREFSGGERVILAEAVSLALTMVACARQGVRQPSLVRDESGAALDPENARVYVSMLRRAANHIGAAHVLLVSHDPQVQELCDERIEIGR